MLAFLAEGVNVQWGGGRFGKETLGCSRKAVERYLERKWITFIPTGGAVEEFPRKAKAKSGDSKIPRGSPSEMTTSKTVLGTL